MSKKVINLVFVIVFLLMIYIPLFFTNLKSNVISETENRYLANFPKIKKEDGSFNLRIIREFEDWFNDNVGFRIQLVRTNANIQYYVFNRIERNDMHLGPNGELNYATSDILKDYQHLNLKSDKELELISNSYQIVSDYLKSRGIQYYYMQCWDKHSIYPEQFSTYVNQYGKISKTDQIVKVLKENTDINLISLKETLISNKEDYELFSEWGDPTHWTQRGAYIGYLELINSINSNNHNAFKVLKESDYNITIDDYGENIFGSIHKTEMLESFHIKNPQAIKINSRLSLYSEDERHSYYVNESVKKKKRVLILGDSYLNNYILDDIAESFYETILIWGDYSSDLIEIIDEYEPDIVINENAERVDRTNTIIDVAKKIINMSL